MAKQFLVIDVETPNRRNDRICAISAIQIVDWIVTERLFFMVNPEAEFEQFNVDLHGITEKTVANAVTFPEIWRILEGRFNSSVIVAHNAPFDIRVMESCCAAFGIPFQRPRYVDTVQLARAALPQLSHHRLNDVCEAWGIPLDHHNAESDCTACAEILVRCASNGVNVRDYERQYKKSERGQWDNRQRTSSSVPPPPVRLGYQRKTDAPKKQHKDGMPLWVKILLVIAVLVGIASRCSGPSNSPSDDRQSAAVSSVQEIEQKEENPKYLKKIQWADLHNYKCAVERDDFDGDVLAAGKYTAYPSATDNLGKGDVPIVWDIYVSKHNYDTMDELTEKEHVATVGGWNNDSATIKLRKGRYLYIKYNNMAGKPVGILNIQRKSGK